MEDAQFGGFRIASLPFADDVVLLALLSCDLMVALGQFVAKCEAAEMRINTSNSEAMVLSPEKGGLPALGWECVVASSEGVRYLRVLFTNEERMELEIDKWKDVASAVRQILYQSVLVKRQLYQKAKIPIYWLIYVPTLIYGYKLWVVTPLGWPYGANNTPPLTETHH